jgi:hypothetical protein
MKKGQKGGSYSSDKVNSSSVEKGQIALSDIFNLTAMPDPSKMAGGASKTKRRRSKSPRKGTKKRSLRAKKNSSCRKMTRKAKKQNGGGVLNVGYGCGFVNTADLNRHGCDPEKVRNPPNLGSAGSGLLSVDGHAGI